MRNGALGATALLLARPARLASTLLSSAPDARIEILPEEVLGTISPNLYGHFLEHIGGVIYDGVWVGENSKIPNVGGVRKAHLGADTTGEVDSEVETAGEE